MRVEVVEPRKHRLIGLTNHYRGGIPIDPVVQRYQNGTLKATEKSDREMRTLLVSLVFAAVLAPGGASANGYPTAARADYVFACMASNGQTQEALNRCSCSIDVIASILSYEEYVQAETILRMRLMSGEKSTVFRDAALYKGIVDELRMAQAESEIRCF